MAKMTGEVVPTPEADKPYKVVMRHPDRSIAQEQPVGSIAEGETLILEIADELQKLASEGGHLDL
ncbi:hypothetical protein [Mesorhizobium sp. 43Arga]